MRLRNKTIVSVMVLVMLLTTSCTGGGTQTPTPRPATITPESTNTPIPTVVEPGLAYGIPCQPPCWRNLIPGDSTCQEVEQAMKQLQVSGWADHIDGSCVGRIFSISPSSTGQGTVDVIMDDSGDTVTTIKSPTLLSYYPVGTLIEQSGGPEGIYLVSSAAVCSSCEEWSPPDPPDAPVMSVPVHLLYPSQGLWFLALIPLDGLGCICPEMKVVSFCYYAPVSMQEALKDNYLADLCVGTLAGVTEDDLVEWHGFGSGY